MGINADCVPIHYIKSVRYANMHARLTQWRLHQLGHIRRMHDGYIHKDLLYRELLAGSRSTGFPFIWYSDTCKHDLMTAVIHVITWEELALNCNKLCTQELTLPKPREVELYSARRREAVAAITHLQPSAYVCKGHAKDYHSWISLLRQKWRCLQSNQNLDWVNLLSIGTDGAMTRPGH